MTRFKHDDRDGPRRDAIPEESGLGSPSSGTGRSPILIDEAGIAELIAFFKLLAKWDKEARCHEKMQ
jgi:hypothetical protein